MTKVEHEQLKEHAQAMKSEALKMFLNPQTKMTAIADIHSMLEVAQMIEEMTEEMVEEMSIMSASEMA